MGELKPIGSEKLAGDAKLKRILELTYYQSSSESKKSPVIVKETKTGVYGIVKEKDGYYVKKGLNESSLDYIGGLFMKNKNRFSSYGEAFKKADFLAEQELLVEATKYVLKTKKSEPQAEAPVAKPTNEPPIPAAAPGDETPPPDFNEMPSSPEDELGGEETPAPEGEEDYLKVIQKLSGKLGEKLRTYEEKLKSEDIKYVLKMVISAINLDTLEETDKEEVLDLLEPDETEESAPGSEEEIPSEPTDTTPSPGDELGETDGQAALEELIGTSFFEDNPDSGPYDDDDDDESDKFDVDAIDDAEKAAKFAAQQDMEKEFPDEDLDFEKHKKREEAAEQSGSIPYENTMSPDEEKELDIDELTNMVNTSVKETLGKYFSE
jgi:hypothetical protein